MLTKPPILAFPNFKLSNLETLETDASGVGLGAVLSQQQGNNGTTSCRPIAYDIKTLQEHECNYGISELEALAVVWATKHFHAYLCGHQCKVLTDHSALKSLLNTQHPSGKLAHWGLVLQELDLDIQYRPGKQNSVADALSCISLNTETNQDVTAETVEAPLQPTPLIDAIVATLQMVSPRSEDECEWSGLLTYLKTGKLPATDIDAKQLVLTFFNYSPMDGVFYYNQPDGHLASSQRPASEAHPRSSLWNIVWAPERDEDLQPTTTSLPVLVAGYENSCTEVVPVMPDLCIPSRWKGSEASTFSNTCGWSFRLHWS